MTVAEVLLAITGVVALTVAAIEILRNRLAVTQPRALFSGVAGLCLTVFCFGGLTFREPPTLSAAVVIVLALLLVYVALSLGERIAKRWPAATVYQVEDVMPVRAVTILAFAVASVSTLCLALNNAPVFFTLTADEMRRAVYQGDLAEGWLASTSRFTGLYILLIALPGLFPGCFSRFERRLCIATGFSIAMLVSALTVGRWPLIIALVTGVHTAALAAAKEGRLRVSLFKVTSTAFAILIFAAVLFSNRLGAKNAEIHLPAVFGLELSEPLWDLIDASPAVGGAYLSTAVYLAQGTYYFSDYLDGAQPNYQGTLYFGWLLRLTGVIDWQDYAEEKAILAQNLSGSERFTEIWATGLRELVHDAGMPGLFIALSIVATFVGFASARVAAGNSLGQSLLYTVLAPQLTLLPLTSPVLNPVFFYAFNNVLVITVVVFVVRPLLVHARAATGMRPGVIVRSSS